MTTTAPRYEVPDRLPPPNGDFFEGRPWRYEDLKHLNDQVDEAQPSDQAQQGGKRARSPLLGCLLVLLFPLVVPAFLLWLPFRYLMPTVRWVERYLDDPGPHNFWGPPKPVAIWEVMKAHGCYYLHGGLGSGKTMGAVLLGLVMAWHQATQHEDEQFLFVNFTVNEYRCRILLLLMGCPRQIVHRLRIEQFSVMDLREETKLHVWRRRFSVIVGDELPYYMEEDKKTVRSQILRHFRMARRRQQIVIGVGQELIHSRYRPLFRLRGQCGQSFGRMRIVWRGAQDPVDNKKPTKPQAVTAYGLDVRRLAKCYDTWEDLEDLDEDATEISRTVRRVA